jgi:hypothetical protein
VDRTKKQILFVESFPEVMTYKIAKLFKEKNYETVSLRILESKDPLFNEFYKKAFDKIESFDLSFFKMDLKNLSSIFISLLKKMKKIFGTLFFCLRSKPYVVIARAKPSWPCAMMRILFWRTPFIYFPYDIRSEDCISLEAAKKKGLKKFEINAEKFCFEMADGIIHKNDPNELSLLEGRIFKKINFAPLQITIHPYCSEEFIVPFNKNKLSKKDKEIHIVQVSSVGSVDIKEISFLVDYFKEFIKNKIHIHLYTKPNTLLKEEIIKSFENAYEKEMNSKYFHLHEPLDPKELIKETSKYDFGIFILPPTDKENIPLDTQLSLGNKQASYLEAGLPFFYPPEIKYLDSIMNSYGLRLYMRDKDDIKNIKKNVKRLNYAALEKKVKKIREEFLMEKHFPELEKFVKEVVDRKKV